MRTELQQLREEEEEKKNKCGANSDESIKLKNKYNIDRACRK